MIEDELSCLIKKSGDGIKSVVLTDREGVEIWAFNGDSNYQIISTIFSLISEQSSKLSEFQNSNYLINYFNNSKMLIQYNLNPVILNISADSSKIGEFEIIELAKQIGNILSNVKHQFE
jgi:hypothetical protein